MGYIPLENRMSSEKRLTIICTTSQTTPTHLQWAIPYWYSIIMASNIDDLYLSSVCVVNSCLSTGSRTKHTASVHGALQSRDNHVQIEIYMSTISSLLN